MNISFRYEAGVLFTELTNGVRVAIGCEPLKIEYVWDLNTAALLGCARGELKQVFGYAAQVIRPNGTTLVGYSPFPYFILETRWPHPESLVDELFFTGRRGVHNTVEFFSVSGLMIPRNEVLLDHARLGNEWDEYHLTRRTRHILGKK